ncbi:MAG: terpene synthase family protein [Dehalococcoidia bacterium]
MTDSVAGSPLTIGSDIAALARDVCVDLNAWAKRWPIFDRARFRAVALTAAVQLSDLPHEARALAGLVSLWIIAFDEVVDEDRLDSGQLAQLVQDCSTIVDARPLSPAAAADPLLRSLQEIIRNVAVYSSFPVFAEAWRQSFSDMLQAIVEHRHLAGGEAAERAEKGRNRPSYEAMLAVTAQSIGVRCYLLTCSILYDDPALGRHLPALAEISAVCARAIRLANDLRTWEKDADEGSANTLWAIEGELRRADPAISTAFCRARALEVLQDRLAATVDEARALLLAADAPTARVRRGIDRLLTFVTELYARFDYHQLGPETAD